MPASRLALVGLIELATAQSGWQADARVVRETAAKQPAFNFEESKVSAEAPLEAGRDVSTLIDVFAVKALHRGVRRERRVL